MPLQGPGPVFFTFRLKADAHRKDHDAVLRRPVQLGGVVRIDLPGGVEGPDIVAVQEEHDGGPVAFGDHALQLPQVLGPAAGDGIWKAGRPIQVQGAVLDLQVDQAPLAIPRQDIDPAGLGTVADLRAHIVQAGQARQPVQARRFRHDLVGNAGVDADPGLLPPAGQPGVLQLPVRIRGGLQQRQVPGRPARPHGARVGAVGGDHGAVLQRHIRQEALVALEDPPWYEPRPGNHGTSMRRKPPPLDK